MKNDVETIKKRILPILKKAGVSRSALFGSYATGTTNSKSDVDILIDFPKEKSLLDFVELKMELENKLGKNVDLVEYSTIKPRLKKYILNRQIQII